MQVVVWVVKISVSNGYKQLPAHTGLTQAQQGRTIADNGFLYFFL